MIVLLKDIGLSTEIRDRILKCVCNGYFEHASPAGNYLWHNFSAPRFLLLHCLYLKCN